MTLANEPQSQQTQYLVQTDRGLYCPAGDFYVDPWKPVPRAVVTHAHSDHAVYGCGAYLVVKPGINVFRKRLGLDARIKTLDYGETLTLNGVQVSLHPAGHILGSAQVRIEQQGYVTVVSGDYKTEADRTCAPFEPVSCHHFITEATFGLPIYRWLPQQVVFDQINTWWRANAASGKASVMYCYALGKAQRVIAGVDPGIGPIVTHGAVEALNAAYRASGVALPDTLYAMNAERSQLRGALIIAPLSARGTSWLNRFGEHASAFASGWMRIRGTRRRQAVDRGFVLSDHVDWDSLFATIRATGATRIGVTHGYIAVVSRWLIEQGMDAYGIETRYSNENDDAAETATAEENDPIAPESQTLDQPGQAEATKDIEDI